MLKIWAGFRRSTCRRWSPAPRLGARQPIEAGGNFGVVDTPRYRHDRPKVPVLGRRFVLWSRTQSCLSGAHRARISVRSAPHADADRWMDWQRPRQSTRSAAFWQLIASGPRSRSRRIDASSAQAAMAMLDTHLAGQPW
jgi:glutathione S-transferase